MSSKMDVLESKIRKILEELGTLRRDNARLKNECDLFKSQISLTTGESRKAQRLLTDYDQLKRNHDQVTARVEKALHKLQNLRLS